MYYYIIFSFKLLIILFYVTMLGCLCLINKCFALPDYYPYIQQFY